MKGSFAVSTAHRIFVIVLLCFISGYYDVISLRLSSHALAVLSTGSAPSLTYTSSLADVARGSARAADPVTTIDDDEIEEDEEEDEEDEEEDERPRLLHVSASEFYFPPDPSSIFSPLPLDPFPISAALVQSSKYFIEAFEHNAGGAVDGNLNAAPFGRKAVLGQLIVAFHEFMQNEGLIFWLAHGTLMGQKWGQSVMTHDPDVDVQISLATMSKLSRVPQPPRRPRYYIDINPHWVVRFSKRSYTGAEGNIIDGRFVDSATGVYIDITVLSALSQDDPRAYHPYIADPLGLDEIVHDKSIHPYNISSISPLIACPFEGRMMWCPQKSDEILQEEYPYTSNSRHHGWKYDDAVGEWMPMKCSDLAKMFTAPVASDCDSECRYVVANRRRIFWVPQSTRTSCSLMVQSVTAEGFGPLRAYEGKKAAMEPLIVLLPTKIWEPVTHLDHPKSLSVATAIDLNETQVLPAS